jgi:hypothetical protein
VVIEMAALRLRHGDFVVYLTLCGGVPNAASSFVWL